jgi:hypothetical protein
VREANVVTHIPLGRFYSGALARKNVAEMVQAPAPVSWNIRVQ